MLFTKRNLLAGSLGLSVSATTQSATESTYGGGHMLLSTPSLPPDLSELVSRTAAIPLVPGNQQTIENGARRFDVRQYAYGVSILDGLSHPLSRKYPTLAAAQAVYPRVNALTEEIGFHAVQAAIDASVDTGGEIYIAPGTVRMGNRQINMPINLNVSTTLKGAGRNASKLYWDQDVAAAGQFFGMSQATRHSGSRIILRDLNFQGPGRNVPLGRSPCNLRGVGMCSKWEAYNCSSSNWFADWCVYDDHCVLAWVDAGAGSFYGVMFDENTVDYGDHLFFRANLGGCLKASLAVSPTNQIEHSLFIDSHLGFSPYAIYRPALSAHGVTEQVANLRPLLTNTRFIKAQAESCGNGGIFSELSNTNGDKIDKCVFEDIQFLPNSSYSISGVAKSGYCTVNVVSNSVIRGPHTIFGGGWYSYFPAAVGFFNCPGAFQSNRFEVGYYDFAMSGSATNPPVVSPIIIFNTGAGGEQFDFALCGATSTITTGNVVVADGLNAKAFAAGAEILGVCRNSASAGQGVIIITHGMVTTNKVGAAISNGDQLVVDEGGSGAVRTLKSGPPTSGVIGYARGSAPAGSGSVDMCVALEQTQFIMPVVWNDFIQDNAANHTLAISDIGHTVELTNASGGTLTIPPADNASAAFPPNCEITVVPDTSAGAYTLALGSGVSVKPVGKIKFTADLPVTFKRRGTTNVWRAYGSLNA